MKQATEMKHSRVVAAVVKRGDRYLCMRRCRSKYAYISEKWEFPGGKVEPDESDRDALRREIKEEMDWDVCAGEALATVEYSYPDFSLTLVAYLCEAPADDSFKLLEHTDYCWLKADELLSLDWTAADAELIRLAWPEVAAERHGQKA